MWSVTPSPSNILLKLYKFIDLSAEEDKNLNPSAEKETPFIVWLWSYKEIKLFLWARSHILIYPSCAPEINLFKANEHFDITLIPSECPSKVPKKGLANILCSLVALNALWNSLALEKLCSAFAVRITEEEGSCEIVAILTIVDVLLLKLCANQQSTIIRNIIIFYL